MSTVGKNAPSWAWLGVLFTGIVASSVACRSQDANALSIRRPGDHPATLPRRIPALDEWIERLTGEQEPDLIEAASVIASHALKVPIAYETLPESLAPILAAARRRMPARSSPKDIIAALNLELLPAMDSASQLQWGWLWKIFSEAIEGSSLPRTLLYLIAADGLGLKLGHLELPYRVQPCTLGSGDSQIRVETMDQGRHHHDHPIRQSLMKPNGSFNVLPASAEDLQLALRPLGRKAFALLILARALPKYLDTAWAIQETPALLLARIHNANEGGDWNLERTMETRGISTYPFLPVFPAYRTIANLALGDLRNAQADALKAQQLAPDWGPFYTLEARVLRKLKRPVEALRKAEQGTELHPSMGFTLREHAESLVANRRYLEAMQRIDEAIRLEPLDATNFWIRSEIWAFLGNEAQWEKDEKKAQELERLKPPKR
jgi:tetratricopeptide (TPR) repeat protein